MPSWFEKRGLIVTEMAKKKYVEWHFRMDIINDAVKNNELAFIGITSETQEGRLDLSKISADN